MRRDGDYLRFNCPFCHDEYGRGWFTMSKKGLPTAGCWLCGKKTSLRKFLEFYNLSSDVLRKHTVDQFMTGTQADYENSSLYKKTKDKPKHRTADSVNSKLESSEQPMVKGAIPAIDSQRAMSYLEKRKLPIEHIKTFYYAKSFREFYILNTKKPTKLSSDAIVIPYISTAGEIVGFVCRMLNKKVSVKYLSVFPYIGHSKGEYLFNEQNVNHKYPVIALEGEIDACSVFNGVGLGSVTGWRKARHLKDVIFVPDGDYSTNPNVFKSVADAANCGLSGFLPNENLDANDMLVSGLSPLDIHDYIANNALSGLDLKLKLSKNFIHFNRTLKDGDPLKKSICKTRTVKK